MSFRDKTRLVSADISGTSVKYADESAELANYPALDQTSSLFGRTNESNKYYLLMYLPHLRIKIPQW